MAALNPKLKDLLMREAHLRLTREELKPVWAEKEAELRAVEATRPFFMPGFSKNKRREYEARLAAAHEAVGVLRRGMEVIDQVEPRVKKMIEEHIENGLRAENPAYVRALGARRQKEDWERCIGRFADKVHELTVALGTVRIQATSGYSRHANAYSASAQQAFALAVMAAKTVAEEVKFANKVAEAQAKTFLENGFELRPLPRVPETDYAGWVQRISAMPLDEAQVEFDKIIEQTKKLHESGVADLRQLGDNMDQMQEIEIHNFLLVVWERYRAEILPEIFAGDTEHVVAETEEMVMSDAEIGELVAR